MKLEITVKGLEELLKKMQAFPRKLDTVMEKTLETILLTVWEHIEPYPDPPDTSTYRRTGTLGRTLGIDPGGFKSGTPDIYEVKTLGAYSLARFGTRLDYAPYVIGDPGKEQAWMHRGRWWTLPGVAEKARGKIQQVWETLADKMADFIGGGEL
jgi:hypothetical protein